MLLSPDTEDKHKQNTYIQNVDKKHKLKMQISGEKVYYKGLWKEE